MPLSGVEIMGKFMVDAVISLLLISGAVASSRSRALTILIVILTGAGLLIGQLYPAILIAGLLGMALQGRSRE